MKTITTYDEQISKLVPEWKNPDVPGGAIAVLKEGELVFCRAYGSANLDKKEPFTTDHKFCIASTTKQFTTTCILILEDKGLLSLDDDIQDYLSDCISIQEPITIRQLCNNVSGIRDYMAASIVSGNYQYKGYTNENVAQIISLQRTLNNSPGTAYRYSNSNFMLLSWIIERVTDKGFQQVMDEFIFQPLGMHRTQMGLDNLSPGEEKFAIGYAGSIEDGFKAQALDLVVTGDGGILGSIEDLAKWQANFEHNCLPVKNLLNRLRERATLADGAASQYGLGLFVQNYRGLQIDTHGGGVEGYMTACMRFPEKNLSVIMFSSGFVNAYEISMRVADVFLDEMGVEPEVKPVPVPADDPVASQYIGYYQDHVSGVGYDFKVKEKNIILDFFGIETPLFKYSDQKIGTLIDATHPQMFDLIGANGTPQIQVRLSGVLQGTFDRVTITPKEKPMIDFNEYQDTYYCNELDSTYCFAEKDGKLIISSRTGPMGKFGECGLSHKGQDSFVMVSSTGDDMAICFMRDSDNSINGFIGAAIRAEGLQFRRVER